MRRPYHGCRLCQKVERQKEKENKKKMEKRKKIIRKRRGKKKKKKTSLDWTGAAVAVCA